MSEPITSNVYESTACNGNSTLPRGRSAWLKMSVVAAVTVLTGGMAAAWYYRKALSQLQQAQMGDGNSNFGISESSDSDGI